MKPFRKNARRWLFTATALSALCLQNAQAQTSLLLKRDYATDPSDAKSLAKGQDGSFYFTGLAAGEGAVAAAPILVVKTNAAGNTVWTKNLNRFSMFEEGARILMQAPDRLLVAGLATDGTGTQGMGVLYQLDTSGVILWERAYGFPGKISGFIDAKLTADGIVLCGHITENATLNKDGWLVKTDALGNLLWQQTYGGAAEEELLQIELSVDGGYLLAGLTAANRTSELLFDGWLLKTNPLGTVLWSQTLGTPDTVDRFISLAPVGDAAIPAGYLISGERHRLGHAYDSEDYLARMDTSGNIVWETPLPSLLSLTTKYIVRQVAPETFCLIASGNIADELSGLQAYIVNAGGAIQNSQVYSGTETGIITPNDLQAGPGGDIYVVGQFTDPDHNRLAFMTRLSGLIPQSSAISEIKSAPAFRLFPNPALRHCRISSDAPIRLVQVQNLQGQTVREWQGAGANALHLDLDGLTPGCYFVTLRTTTGNSSTATLLVQQ